MVEVSAVHKVTVITVVLNDVMGIKETVESVLAQDYPDVEFIVLDGGSTDGTLDILEEYRDKIDVLNSGPDGGIYQAMNKGAALATGSWLAYINSSDSFVNSSVISRLFDGVETSWDVVYGNNFYIKKANRLLQKARPLTEFYKGMPFNHQSCFVSTRLMRERPFEDKLYKIQCEYNFLLGLYLDGFNFHQVDVAVANYLAGGFSDQHFVERAVERWLINKRLAVDDGEVDRHYTALIGKNLAKTGVIEPSLPKDGIRHHLKQVVRRLYERLSDNFSGNSKQG